MLDQMIKALTMASFRFRGTFGSGARHRGWSAWDAHLPTLKLLGSSGLVECLIGAEARHRQMLTWTAPSETSRRLQRLFKRRAKSQSGSGNTPLALAEGWSPPSMLSRQHSGEDEWPASRGRARQRKRSRTWGCLFGCGTLPRDATPDEAICISPAVPSPRPARQLHAVFKDRARRSSSRRDGVVEQICYKGCRTL
eukprot:s36_g11.t1